VTEETITYNIVYNVQNINDSVRSTQRMLYFTNALRLSITDMQQVMAGPTFANVMWTSVQLTRVWTNLYRIITATNKAQAAGGVAGALGGRGGAARRATGIMGTNQAMNALFDPTWTPQKTLWQVVSGFVSANPYTIGAAVVALTVAGVVAYDIRQKRMHKDWQVKQREAAKAQGFEY